MDVLQLALPVEIIAAKLSSGGYRPREITEQLDHHGEVVLGGERGRDKAPSVDRSSMTVIMGDRGQRVFSIRFKQGNMDGLASCDGDNESETEDSRILTSSLSQHLPS
jgi:hypothetical protein